MSHSGKAGQKRIPAGSTVSSSAQEVLMEQEGIPTWIAIFAAMAVVVAFIIVGAILSAVFQMT
jgi:hypothetical protein